MRSPSDAPLEKWLPYMIAAITIAVGVWALDARPVGVFYDDAMYVLLGKAIASGHGYRYLNLPGTPEATHYPPGYPALLALLWTLAPSFPSNVMVFKVANVLCAAIAAVGIYFFAMRRVRLAPLTAASAAVVGALSLPALYLTSMVLSEPLFLAMLVWLLVLSERVVYSSESRRDALLVGAGIGLLALVRTLGVLLLPVVIVLLWSRGRRRDALWSLLATSLTLAPWLWWVRQHDSAFPSVVSGAYGSYTQWLVDSWGTGGWTFVRECVAANAATAYTIVARTFSPKPWPVLDALIVAMLLGLTVIGALAARKRMPLMLGFLALYGAVVVVWPFPPVRFIANVWSPLLLLAVVGMDALVKHARDHRSKLLRVAPIGAYVLLGGALAWQTMTGYRAKAWSSLAQAQASRIDPKLTWLARYAKPSDVIATEDEPAVFLYTGRQAVPAGTFTGMQHVVPRTPAEDARALHAIMATYRPSIVLVGTPGPVEGAALLAKSEQAPLRYAGAIPASRVYLPTRRTIGAR